MPYDKNVDAYVAKDGQCYTCENQADPRYNGYCASCARQVSKQTDAVPDQRKAAQQELARRELARRHLLPFTQRLVSGYRAGWFHKLLAKKLEQFSEAIANGRAPRLAISCPPRHGKACADSTPVLTTEGWKTHGELQPGDYVFRPSGAPTRVVAVSEPCIAAMEVELTNGEVVKVHENHEWTVWHRGPNRWKTVETGWFLRPTSRGPRAGQPRALWSGPRGSRGGRARFQLPKVGALETPEIELPMDPYVLGAWLGDGTKGVACLTHDAADTAVVEAFEAKGYPVSSRTVHASTGVHTTRFAGPRPNVRGRLTTELQALGVWADKRIPQVFKLASVAQRLELLAGLIDTDGSVDHTGRVRFSTVCPELAADVAEVARSLGWRTGITEYPPTISSSGIQGRRSTYQVSFSPDRDIPVRLERKRIGRFANKRAIGIADVRRAEHPEVARCIQVEADDGLYLVGRQLVPTHNSELASKSLVAWHLGRHPSARIISAAHSDRLAVDNSRDVLQYIKDVRYKQVFDLQLSKDQQGAMGWRTAEAGMYKPVGVGAGVAGYGANMLILDDIVRDQDAYSPTVRDNVWQWYKSSARTRLMPGGGICMIGTRWVLDDPIGRALDEEGLVEEGGRWDFIRFPLEAEDDEYLTPEGHITRGDPGRADVRLLRRRGELLDSDRWSPEDFEEHKADPVTFQALFQQSPTAGEAATFSEAMFETCACTLADIPKRLTHYSTWDTALGEKQIHDFSACTTGGVDEGGVLWLVDVEEERFAPDDLIEAMIDNYFAYRQQLIGVEKTQFTVGLKPAFERRITERHAHGLPLEELPHGNKDKIARARPLQARMRRGYVRIPTDAPWFERLKKQMLEFPGGRNDDMVDAFAYLASMLESMTSPQTERPKPEVPSWTRKLGAHTRRPGRKSWRAA